MNRCSEGRFSFCFAPSRPLSYLKHIWFTFPPDTQHEIRNSATAYSFGWDTDK